jgi:O-antigen/teichoic acid export membrane protein
VANNEIKNQTSKSIAKNIGFGFLSWILPIGFSIYATPKILNGLGHADYGVYSLILGFISYSFTFGIGRAATKYIAEYRQTTETKKISEAISATLFVCVIVGLFGAIFISLTANWLTVDVFKVESSLQSITIQSFYLAAATIFVMMLSQVFSGIIQGIHRFDIYSSILNFNSFSTLIGNIVLVYFGFGLVPLLWWNLLTNAITCYFYYIYAKKYLSIFKLNFRFSQKMLRQVSRFSLGLVVYQVFANLTFLTERGLITRQFGTENLTYYILPMTLAMYVHGVISSLTLVLFPLASELTDQPEKLLRLYTKATKIVCGTVVFIGGSLIVVSKLFLTLWVGSEIALKSSNLLIIHSVTFSILAVMIISWQLREGLGLAFANGILGLSWFIISVPLMFILGDYYGLEGIGIARMIGLFPIVVATFYFEKKIFKQVPVAFWLELLLKLGITFSMACIGEIMVLNYLAETWTTLVIAGFTGAIVFVSGLWFVNFITPDEKLYIRNLIKR